VNGAVFSLETLHSWLYVGGSFTEALDISNGTSPKQVTRLARWCLEGQVFESVQGSGALKSVCSMARVTDRPAFTDQYVDNLVVCPE
jgi:hypothetical protein